MNLIQIFIALFVVYVIYRLIIKLKTKQLKFRFFVLWLGFWLFIVANAFFPSGLNFVAQKVGVGRGVDVAIYLAVLLIFYLVFRVFVRLEIIEQKIVKLTRALAYNEEKINKEDDKSEKNQ